MGDIATDTGRPAGRPRPVTSELALGAGRLRDLHHADRPLVLPNAWDAASARAIERAGFPAVATSSAAMVGSLGYRDGSCAPAPEVFDAVARIARSVRVPVTADLEDGYGLSPDELVARALSAGVVGCNLEDSDHRGGAPLIPLEDQVSRLAATKEAGRQRGVDLVLNARVDVFVRAVGAPGDRVGEALRRCRAYLEAGAECVYPITASDDDTVAALVEGAGGPVNVMATPDPADVARLARLGVARISFGSGVARVLDRRLAGLLDDLRMAAT